MNLNEAYKELEPFFKKAETDQCLATYLLRAAQGATMDTKNLGSIADMLYSIAHQPDKTEAEIKAEYKGIAAGLVVNKTINATERPVTA